MTGKATLDDFEAEPSSEESSSFILEERLLTPISPSVGLRVIPGRGDPLYLQNRGRERVSSAATTTGGPSSNPQRKTQKMGSSARCISDQTGPNGWRSRHFVDRR